MPETLRTPLRAVPATALTPPMIVDVNGEEIVSLANYEGATFEQLQELVRRANAFDGLVSLGERFLWSSEDYFKRHNVAFPAMDDFKVALALAAAREEEGK